MVVVSLCSVYRTTCIHSHYIMANVNKVDFGDYVITPVANANIVRKARLYNVLALFKSNSFICVPILTKRRCYEETTNISCEEY